MSDFIISRIEYDCNWQEQKHPENFGRLVKRSWLMTIGFVDVYGWLVQHIAMSIQNKARRTHTDVIIWFIYNVINDNATIEISTPTETTAKKLIRMFANVGVARVTRNIF